MKSTLKRINEIKVKNYTVGSIRKQRDVEETKLSYSERIRKPVCFYLSTILVLSILELVNLEMICRVSYASGYLYLKEMI